MKYLSKDDAVWILEHVLSDDSLTNLYTNKKPTKKDDAIKHPVIAVAFCLAILLVTFMGTLIFGIWGKAGNIALFQNVLMPTFGFATIGELIIFAIALWSYGHSGLDTVNKETSKEEQLVNFAFERFGLDGHMQFVIKSNEFKNAVNSLSSLLKFCSYSSKYDKAHSIVSNLPDIELIVEALDRSWKASTLDSDSSQELIKNYWIRFDKLEDELYDLCKPDVNKLVFELLKQNRTEYLPQKLSKDFSEIFNQRVLAGIKKEAESEDEL